MSVRCWASDGLATRSVGSLYCCTPSVPTRNVVVGTTMAEDGRRPLPWPSTVGVNAVERFLPNLHTYGLKTVSPTLPLRSVGHWKSWFHYLMYPHLMGPWWIAYPSSVSSMLPSRNMQRESKDTQFSVGRSIWLNEREPCLSTVVSAWNLPA